MNIVMPAVLCAGLAGAALCTAASVLPRFAASAPAPSVEALAHPAAPSRPPRLKRLRWDHDRHRRGPAQA